MSLDWFRIVVLLAGMFAGETMASNHSRLTIIAVLFGCSCTAVAAQSSYENRHKRTRR